MDVDAAEREGASGADFPLNAKLSLLGNGVLVVLLTSEQHRQRRNRPGMSNVDTELRQICRCDAGIVPRRWDRALNFALREQRLENSGGRKRRIAWRAGKRHENLGDLTETIDEAKGLDHVRDLSIHRRVVDSISRAYDSLVGLERVPRDRNAWSKVIFIGIELSVLHVQFIAH